MKRCYQCLHPLNTWLQNQWLEVYCANCKVKQPERFVEILHKRKLSYMEAIRLYEMYEAEFIQHDANKLSSWAELDVALNESISRRIRNITAKDKLA